MNQTSFQWSRLAVFLSFGLWIAYSLFAERLVRTGDVAKSSSVCATDEFTLDKKLPAGPAVSIFDTSNSTLDSSGSKNNDSGKEIYAAMCASCHGTKGQGVQGEYDYPLRGNLALGQLAELIDETMPEEDPKNCTGEEAEKVADFIRNEFYLEGSSRPKQASIRLSRLTENQYRNAVADLLGQFEWQASVADLRKKNSFGLTGRYFNARGFDEKKFAGQIVDDKIDFDFLTETPTTRFVTNNKDSLKDRNSETEKPASKKEDKKKKEVKKKPADENKPKNDEFSVQWRGGLIAPVTGTYEFVVESPNGFRLFINDYENPVIDRWVSSGEKEHRITMFLLGGRVYPLRLNFFKFKEKQASIRLKWKPPGDTLHVIGNENLVPNWIAQVGLIQTPFPADDSSTGYRRGISVSKQWDEATTRGAVEAANWVVAILKLNDRRQAKENTTRKLKVKFYRFVSRAFCKPLTIAEKIRYVDQFLNSDIPLEDKVKRIVILTLKSPMFLYPNIQVRDSQHELASRIGWCAVDSIADQQLFQAARVGKLENAEQVKKHIQRLVGSQASRKKLDEFFSFWLDMEAVSVISKDQELFPDFDEQVVADLRHSLKLFVNDLVWSDASDFRQLYLSKGFFVNENLAEFYAIKMPGGKARNTPSGGNRGFEKVVVDSQRRAGVLTHPYLMMNLAYHRNSSPIHRGVFIARNLLGRSLKQPPDNVEPLTEEFDPTMTTRERVEFQTKSVACMNCHSVINPLGFSLENYDAVGRFRQKEKGKAIKADSVFDFAEGDEIRFDGPSDLARFLANNSLAQKNFVRHLFEHIVKQPVEAYGENQLDELHARFVSNNYHIRNLVCEIVFVASGHELALDQAPATKNTQHK